MRIDVYLRKEESVICTCDKDIKCLCIRQFLALWEATAFKDENEYIYIYIYIYNLKVLRFHALYKFIAVFSWYTKHQIRIASV